MCLCARSSCLMVRLMVAALSRPGRICTGRGTWAAPVRAPPHHHFSTTTGAEPTDVSPALLP
jgi:hypothetical protein